MADRGDHGERDRLRIERSARARATDPPTPSRRGVLRDLLASLRRAPGNSRAISAASSRWNSTSSSARRSASRSRRRARAPSSLRHSASACVIAASSTSTPCRSYRLRARLKRTTTADNRLCFRARRVSAVSPRGRNTRCSRSAHDMQTGPRSSITRRPSSSLPHPAQVQSRSGETTTRSGARRDAPTLRSSRDADTAPTPRAPAHAARAPSRGAVCTRPSRRAPPGDPAPRRPAATRPRPRTRPPAPARPPGPAPPWAPRR